MAEDTSVKFYSGDMMQSMFLQGNVLTTGRDILMRCLVNGFGETVALSGSITSGVCRINVESGKSFSKYATVLVSGATSPTSANGEHKVIRATTDWFEFNTEEPDGALSGTITVKYAPAGWTEFAPPTSNSIFLVNGDPSADKCPLKVTEDNYNEFKVRAYTELIDFVDDRNNENTTPSYQDYSDCYRWLRSTHNNSDNKNWFIIASNKFFFLILFPYINYPNTNNLLSLSAFGQFNKTTAVVLSKGATTYLCHNRASYSLGENNFNNYKNNAICSRPELPMSPGYVDILVDHPTTSYSGTVGSSWDMRHGGLNLLKYNVYYNDWKIGYIPGMRFIFNNINGKFQQSTVYDNLFGDGRNYFGAYIGTTGSNSTEAISISSGYILFDISGPWD